MTRRFSIVSGVLALLFGGLMLSATVNAGESAIVSTVGPPIPMVFSGIGSAPPSSSCNNVSNGCNGTNCDCLEIDGRGKGTKLGAGKSTFTSQTVVSYPEIVGTICDEAVGTMTITTPNNKNTLVIGYNGLDCLTGASLIGFNGPYTVDGANSTGKFLNAVGGGTMSVTEDSNSNFYGTLNGNILLSK
ncbi:MAG TPA: hypothetical protein VMV15_05970 [Candidatus Binataceae bacterium]|nr:hypothetical protein [Candidatus Binataceae bacterium]